MTGWLCLNDFPFISQKISWMRKCTEQNKRSQKRANHQKPRRQNRRKDWGTSPSNSTILFVRLWVIMRTQTRLRRFWIANRRRAFRKLSRNQNKKRSKNKLLAEARTQSRRSRQSPWNRLWDREKLRLVNLTSGSSQTRRNSDKSASKSVTWRPNWTSRSSKLIIWRLNAKPCNMSSVIINKISRSSIWPTMTKIVNIRTSRNS